MKEWLKLLTKEYKVPRNRLKFFFSSYKRIRSYIYSKNWLKIRYCKSFAQISHNNKKRATALVALNY
jgi:hypothetical protein